MKKLIFLLFAGGCVAVPPPEPRPTCTCAEIERLTVEIQAYKDLLDSCGIHRTYQRDAYLWLYGEKFSEQ